MLASFSFVVFFALKHAVGLIGWAPYSRLRPITDQNLRLSFAGHYLERGTEELLSGRSMSAPGAASGFRSVTTVKKQAFSKSVPPRCRGLA
jgi:hypothetical protein